MGNGDRGPGYQFGIELSGRRDSVRQPTAVEADIADTSDIDMGRVDQMPVSVRGLAVTCVSNPPRIMHFLPQAQIPARHAGAGGRCSRHPFTDSSATIDRSAEGKCQT